MFSSYYMNRDGHVYPNQINQDDAPVAVIPFEDREQVERLLRGQVGASSGCPDVLVIADASIDRMQAALREFADPKPAIFEPMGLGAVVRDAHDRTWIRYLRPGTSAPWLWSEAPPECERLSVWSAIPAVEILSEGVES